MEKCNYCKEVRESFVLMVFEGKLYDDICIHCFKKRFLDDPKCTGFIKTKDVKELFKLYDSFKKTKGINIEGLRVKISMELKKYRIIPKTISTKKDQEYLIEKLIQIIKKDRET